MKARFYLSILLCVFGLIMIMIGLLSFLPQREHVTLNPIADATILMCEPDKNTGQMDVLISGYSESPAWNYSAIPFLMFNLSGIPSGAMDSASLNLYATNITFWGGEAFEIRVCFCTNNEWSESSITYNKVLDFSSAIKEEATNMQVVSTSGLWYTWNVKSDVEQALQFGKLTEVLLVRIKSAQEGSYAIAWFASREIANPPKLDIEITLSKNPVVWLFFPIGFGVICFAGFLYWGFRKQLRDEKIRTGELVEYVDRNGSKIFGTPEQVRRWKEQEEHEKELERLRAGEKQVVVKEIVKVRCSYCGQLFDSTLDRCPHCGAKR